MAIIALLAETAAYGGSVHCTTNCLARDPQKEVFEYCISCVMF